VYPWPTIELPPVGSDGKYRLHVLGASVADVVSSVGGWLCDLAFAGWVIRVVLRDIDDTRALRIIGVGCDPLNLDSYIPGRTRSEGMWAVSAQLAIEDGGVCPPLAEAMRTSAPTFVWGIASPTSMVPSAPSVYRPSAAALAFKKQALLAARISATMFEEREMLLLTPGASSATLRDSDLQDALAFRRDVNARHRSCR
jgi:hypothetical protein